MYMIILCCNLVFYRRVLPSILVEVDFVEHVCCKMMKHDFSCFSDLECFFISIFQVDLNEI